MTQILSTSFRPSRSEARQSILKEIELGKRYRYLIENWRNSEVEIPSFESWKYMQELDTHCLIEPVDRTMQDQDIFAVIEAFFLHLSSAKLSLVKVSTNHPHCKNSGAYYQELFELDNKYVSKLNGLINHYSTVPKLMTA